MQCIKQNVTFIREMLYFYKTGTKYMWLGSVDSICTLLKYKYTIVLCEEVSWVNVHGRSWGDNLNNTLKTCFQTDSFAPMWL